MSNDTTTKTASLIKHLTGYRGDARLYRCDPPLAHTDWVDDSESTHEYVVVSAVVAPFGGPETYIFPGNADGEVTNWGELHGSFSGALDHEAALIGAGYVVVAS